jgi:hypothetical protein
MPKKRKTQDAILEDIHQTLELIVNLLALLVTAQTSVTEGARSLKMAGLDNHTIATILNTTDASVRALTANLRVRLGRRRS